MHAPPTTSLASLAARSCGRVRRARESGCFWDEIGAPSKLEPDEGRVSEAAYEHVARPARLVVPAGPVIRVALPRPAT
jgi:hypothetical protein